jgi:hypothetical protein
MVTFAPVDLPVCEPHFQPHEVDDQILGWIASPPMRALVTSYGGQLPDAGVGDLLTWLDDFSAGPWDFRGKTGVERDQVTARAFEPQEAELIRAAATALGLVEPARPPRSAYDLVFVLGGLGRACLQRTAYAAELILTGVVTTPELAALGSFRQLNDTEKELTPLTGGGYEVDAMDAGVRIGFGLTDPPEREASDDGRTATSWEVRTYRRAPGPEVHVVAAPSTAPDGRRATTPDTYEFWAKRVKLTAADRILVVTSPIYVPFQHSDAIRTLGLRHGCGIDTIGFDPSRTSVPMADGATNPDRYLQEIRSGIRSMRALHEELAKR